MGVVLVADDEGGDAAGGLASRFHISLKLESMLARSRGNCMICAECFSITFANQTPILRAKWLTVTFAPVAAAIVRLTHAGVILRLRFLGVSCVIIAKIFLIVQHALTIITILLLKYRLPI